MAPDTPFDAAFTGPAHTARIGELSAILADTTPADFLAAAARAAEAHGHDELAGALVRVLYDTIVAEVE